MFYSQVSKHMGIHILLQKLIAKLLLLNYCVKLLMANYYTLPCTPMWSNVGEICTGGWGWVAVYELAGANVYKTSF